jgi:hypothetical protein
MSHINLFSEMNSFGFNHNSDELKEYQVEVITFDGESERVFVEAGNEDEAAEIACSMVEDADYTMVYAFA